MNIKPVEMNERDKKVMANGDIGQGEYLVEAKQKNKKTYMGMTNSPK